MKSKMRWLVKEIQQHDKDMQSIVLSDKIETVLCHIWARSIIAAPKNHFRRRWLVALIMFPIQPIINVIFSFAAKKFHFMKFFREILLMPLDLIIIITKIIGDGILSKDIAKKWVVKGDKIDLKFSIMTKLVVVPGLALMQEPYLSQSDSISALQRENTRENREKLMEKIDKYWLQIACS